jgi:hypothetical protein
MSESETNYRDSELQEKRAFWNTTMEQLDRVADGLGKPIDAGIKETVAAFIVNKFPTYGSCEGHVEERFDKQIKLRPYIAVGFDEPRQRYIGEPEIRDRIATEFGILAEDVEENDSAWRAFWNYIHEHNIPETPEFLEIRAKNEELQKSIQEILGTFYQNRQVVEDVRLVCEGIGPVGHFRVTTARENPKHVDSLELEQYQRQLLAEQEEVRAFTQFLKERFFD